MNQKDLVRCENDPEFFRSRLIMDCDRVPRPFRPDPWQREDFAALDPTWLRVAGRDTKSKKTFMRAALTRPRGHSKTTDLAVMVIFALCFSRVPIKGVAAAKDRTQAKLIRDAIERIARLNDFVGQMLTIDNWRVKSDNGSELEITAADLAGGAYGMLLDFIVVDELSHWPDGHEDFWVALYSTVVKRDCALVIIQNAGFREHFVGKLCEKIRNDPAWYWSQLDGPKASWVTRERLDEQRRTLPDLAYRQLIENQWINSSGNAITEQDIDAAMVLDGPPDGPLGTGYGFLGGDLGLFRDRAAVVVTEVDEAGVARLTYLRSWDPQFILGLVRKQIDLSAVGTEIRRVVPAWNVVSGLVDSWQAGELYQNCQRHGLPIELAHTGIPILTEMATIAIERFRDRTIHLWPDEALRKDLCRLRLEVRPGGYKLASPRGPDGHGDRVQALLLSLVAARRFLGTTAGKVPPVSWDGTLGMPGSHGEGRLTAPPRGMFASSWDDDMYRGQDQAGPTTDLRPLAGGGQPLPPRDPSKPRRPDEFGSGGIQHGGPGDVRPWEGQW